MARAFPHVDAWADMNNKEKEAYPGRGGEVSSKSIHQLCQKRLKNAVEKGNYLPGF